MRYPNPPDHARFFEDLSARMQAQPGVEAFSASFPLPMSGRFWTNEYAFDARTEEKWGVVESDNHVVLPGYFRTLGARLLKGRDLTWDDVKQGRKVVVVDERLAEKAFPGQDPIGRYLRCEPPTETGRETRDRRGRRARPPGPSGTRRARADLRDARPVAVQRVLLHGALAAARRARGRDRAGGGAEDRPELALYDVRTLRGYMAQVTAGQRFAMQLLGIFAGLAAVLAASASTARSRTRSASATASSGSAWRWARARATCWGSWSGRGSRSPAWGSAIGIAAALVLSRVLSSLLYGVSAADPLTYGAIVLAVAALALLASYVPALRASRLHPARVLRSE